MHCYQPPLRPAPAPPPAQWFQEITSACVFIEEDETDGFILSNTVSNLVLSAWHHCPLVCDLKANQKRSSVQSEEECVAPNVTSLRIFLLQLKCVAFFSLYCYIVSPIKNPMQVCLMGTCLQAWPRFVGFASFTSDSFVCSTLLM